MLVQGILVDGFSGETLPGVTVSVANAAGQTVGQVTQTSASGAFTIDSPVLSPHGSLGLLFTSVGYQPTLVDPGVFLTNPHYLLERSAQTLDEFVVTLKKPKNWIWLLLAGVGLYYIAKPEKRRNVKSR